MSKIFTLLLLLFNVACFAQLQSGSKVFLEFSDTPNEVNVDANNALDMLREYVKNKSNLTIVSEKANAEYTLLLYVYEKNMGNRMAKIDVVNTNSEVVFECKKKKGTMNAFYGYSGSRHAIGRVFKGCILKEFPNIVVE